MNDVKEKYANEIFSSLLEGYTGEGVTPKIEWGKLQLKTVEEVGLSDHKMVRYLPNDRWTNGDPFPPITEWIGLKAIISSS